MVLKCPGVFSGELIITLDSSHQSILFAIKSTNADLHFCKTIFNELVSQRFSQCIHPFNPSSFSHQWYSFDSITYDDCKQDSLCPKCIRLTFQDTIPPPSLDTISIIPPQSTVCFFIFNVLYIHIYNLYITALPFTRSFGHTSHPHEVWKVLEPQPNTTWLFH